MRINPAAESSTWASLVRSHRQLARVSQEKLAADVGTVRSTVWRWENTDQKPDSYNMAVLVINRLHIDREAGLRAAGFADDEVAPEEPELWTYARSLGLDPHSTVVEEILTAGWSQDMTRRMLREERKLKEDDERRRLERVRLAKDMYRRAGDDDGVDQAAR